MNNLNRLIQSKCITFFNENCLESVMSRTQEVKIYLKLRLLHSKGNGYTIELTLIK